jgi:D-alanyl-D-alanine carboxypeptidase/D-alanyl-D-alanine-endopeptidase (penicillin-binding protein 4)
VNRRWVGAGIAFAIVLVVGAAGVAWWRGVFDDLFGGDEAPETALDVPPPAGLDLPDARTPEPVLEPADGPAVARSALRSRIEPLLADPDLGRHVGFAAYDLTHDRPLWTYGGGTYMPASTLKTFTSVAALEALGGDHVFTTSTALLPGSRGGGRQVVLVGGGDPLLSSQSPRAAAAEIPEPATITELADETARALKERGVTRVSVGYDDSRYVGPSDSPHWELGYVPEETPPVSPLWVDEGADPANPYNSRVLDPARTAGDVLARELAERGITVVGSTTEADAASGRTLAEVESPPLRDIVAHVLDLSDNAGAEVLLREVAIATDRPASFTGGSEAVREVLAGLGVPMRGVETYDGSGLSRDNRITLRALLETLRVASDEDHPQLRDAVTGMSVAGFTGTLAYRFTDADSAAALGVVRAKTGTLSHVHGLAGTTVDRDGVAIAFVALVDRVPLQDTLDARSILDEIAAAVASCGCSR